MATPKSAGRVEYSELARTEALELERIYRTYAARMSCWIQRLAGPDAGLDAQDLLHEVFLVVEARLPEFRGDSKLSTWLYSIAVRVVRGARRKARFRRLLFRRAEPELRLTQRAPETPLSALERDRATAVVYQVLDRLSERDRALIILFELEGLPGDEIAMILGLSPNGVWVSLGRARERFRKALLEAYPDDGGSSR